jgi:membrane-associated phospholipid phosphatase
VSSHTTFGRLFGAVLVLACCPVSVGAADPIKTAGSVLQFVLPATAAALTFGHSDPAGAGQLAMSLGLSEGVTLALKYSIDETRPNGGHLSFPSGHTSLSFASAEFMRRRYGWKFGAPAYALAAFVGYSRIESHEHYTHDVLAGAAVGIISSHLFTNPYKTWTVSAAGDTKSLSISVSRQW